MNAVDEHEIDAGFKELEVHAEARRKEEQAEAEAKRRSKPVLKSTPSMKAGSAYTTKSGAVNSAWGDHAGDVILHKNAIVVVGEDDPGMDEDTDKKRRASTDKSVSVASVSVARKVSTDAGSPGAILTDSESELLDSGRGPAHGGGLAAAAARAGGEAGARTPAAAARRATGHEEPGHAGGAASRRLGECEGGEPVGGDEAGTGCCAVERRGLRLSPWALVGIFIYVNLLNYVDRGLVNGMLPKYCVNCNTRPDEDTCAATVSCEWRANATSPAASSCAFNSSVVPRFGIGGSLGLKETAQGVIAGSFMGGYCVFSPIFAYLSTVYKPFTLMGLGLSAWCLACGLAAVAPTFEALIVARVVSGLGEASFQCIAPCFIDDSAPQSVKGKVLAAFFMAVPIGQAIGYGYGGFMCSSLDPEQLGFAGWRAAFALEGIAMIPLALLCFFVTNRLKDDGAESDQGKSRERTAQDPTRAPWQGWRDAWQLVWSISSNGVWLCTTLGYAAYTFSIGAMAVWAPSYLQRRFAVPLEEADIMFGAVAVVTGLLGTIGGGLLLDVGVKVLKKETQEASLLLTVGLMSAAWPCTYMAFGAADYSTFLVLMFVGQLFAFATTSPVNGVLLWCVPSSARTLSMALSVLAMHLLGDVPSPVVVGAMFEAMGDRPDEVMRLLSGIIGVAIFFWGWGYVMARRRNCRALSLSLSLSFSDSEIPLLDPA